MTIFLFFLKLKNIKTHSKTLPGARMKSSNQKKNQGQYRFPPPEQKASVRLPVLWCRRAKTGCGYFLFARLKSEEAMRAPGLLHSLLGVCVGVRVCWLDGGLFCARSRRRNVGEVSILVTNNNGDNKGGEGGVRFAFFGRQLRKSLFFETFDPSADRLCFFRYVKTGTTKE